MPKVRKPHFTIKNRFQKRLDLYRDILTPAILRDVCERVTGERQYTVDWDDTGYNIGRLAKLDFQGSSNYISFSEVEIKSRNSSFQSFPSALISYHQDPNPRKNLFFYFLASNGNIETDYFIFMYRLMKTAGTNFLNEEDHLETEIVPFVSVTDIIAQRDLNRGRNRGNSSTYVTLDENGALQIFGKTFGANKYETTLLCLAIHAVSKSVIELYEIEEGNLTQLPAAARGVIINLGIRVITSDLVLEQEEFEENDSLRSPTFIYNLLEKLGDKKCILCDCNIPQIIQGAHIWPVASIKRANAIDRDTKLQYALDGDNGIWMCNNHHRLFDLDLILIVNDGRIKYKSNIEAGHLEYLSEFTCNGRIPNEVINPKFLRYLGKRNVSLDENSYSFLA